MSALCFFVTVLSWCPLGGMFRCYTTLSCVSDALYFTKKIIHNVSVFRVVDVRAVAECSSALLRSDFPHPLSEILQPKNATMPKAKKVKVNWCKLFKQIKSQKNQSSSENRPTDAMKKTSCSVPDSDIFIVFNSTADNTTTAQQTVIKIDSDDNEDISVDCDMQHNTGTLHCSADSGPVGDICYGDVKNGNPSELHPMNISANFANVHVDEGTPKTVSDSCRRTDGSEREMLKEKRCWQYTHFGSTLAVDEVKDTPYHLLFTVMSYNVLAQDLLQRHPDLYYEHQPDALNWKYRSQILFSEIQEANADILCLQEVQANQLHSFYRQLNSLGYASIYKQRTGNNVDGVAIYYKRDVFELVDHTSVEYYQPGISILDRHNVGLIAKLAIRANPSRHLVVATTHLLYNPNRHDVKLAQTQVLLAEVERMAFKGFSSGNPTYWPVIITGDMNFEPYTGVYRLLTEGMFRYEGLSNKRLADSFNGRVLSKKLLPRSLDISDTCQHWGILCMRAIEELDYKTQLKFLKIYNTDHQRILRTNMISQTPTSFENLVQNARMMELVNNFVPFFGPSSIPPLPDAGYATGQLTHNLNLCSVYKHGEKDNYLKSEVTSNQGTWVTVDYVFYSCIKNESDEISEGNLKLVSRYRLLTASEADSFGPIPNNVSPSDHYPLLATFFYTF